VSYSRFTQQNIKEQVHKQGFNFDIYKQGGESVVCRNNQRFSFSFKMTCQNNESFDSTLFPNLTYSKVFITSCALSNFAL